MNDLARVRWVLRFKADRAVVPSSLACMLAVAAIGLVAPANGEAAVTTFGSDLSAPANMAEAHGADSVFWGLALPGGRRTVVPSSGQITTIRLKGTAIPSSAAGAPAPLTEVHFQVLHPQADGAVTVSLTSQPFNVPSGGDPGRITTYRPINLCARAGDYVAFNDEGGFEPTYYPQGVPYQVFSQVSGASTSFFSKGNGTNNGATFTGARHEGQELLMQMDLATGPDATSSCRAAPAPVDAIKPTLSSLSFSSTVFKAASSGPAFSAQKRPIGTRVSFSLSEASAVKFTVQRKAKGRKVGRKCVKPNHSNRHNKACVRYVAVRGSFTIAGKAGKNTSGFRGRIGGKSLKPGSYRLNGRATDKSGNKSAIRRKSFRIVK